VRTALATAEPDEPDRRAALTLIASTIAAATTGGGVAYLPGGNSLPPVTAATWPARITGQQPWQCPDCRLWMAPAVATHRCKED
jgi:hypothetical protein